MFNWIKNLFSSEPSHPSAQYPGVLLDTRSPEDKESDIHFGEIVSQAVPVQWREKAEKEIRVYRSQDQHTQSSCVANAGRKALSVMMREAHNLDIDFSSLDIYRRRFNYPAGGMAAYDLWNICKQGVALNDVVPSDGFTESYANALVVDPWKRKVGDAFMISGGINLPINDIDAVASVIQKTGKGVVIFYYFTGAEFSKKFPDIQNQNLVLSAETTTRHAVCAVDFTLINGVKHLVIEDSALFGSIDRRYISENFHEKRSFYAGYPMRFVFSPEEKTKAPTHLFKIDMKLGETSEEIKTLQECLQYIGLFPSNITPTGYYGSVTAVSVLAFQKKYGVGAPSSLDFLGGKQCGPLTRQALNRIFS